MVVQRTIKNLKTSKIVYIEFIDLEDVYYEYNYIKSKKVDLIEFTDNGFYYIVDGIEKEYKFLNMNYEDVYEMIGGKNM